MSRTGFYRWKRSRTGILHMTLHGHKRASIYPTGSGFGYTLAGHVGKQDCPTEQDAADEVWRVLNEGTNATE